MNRTKPTPTHPEVAKEDSQTPKHDLPGKKDPHEKVNHPTKKGPDKLRPLRKSDLNATPGSMGGEERGLPAGSIGYLHSTPIINAVTLPGTSLYFYIAEDDPTIYLGVANPLNKPQATKRHDKPLTALAASGDGLRLLTSDYTGGVQVWSVENRKVVVGRVHVLKQHTSPVKVCALSHDGSRGVSIDQDGLACAWNITDGTLIHKFTIEGAQLAAFLPDGKSILSGNEAMGAGIWNVETGQSKLLPGKTGGVRAVCVSSDGKLGYAAGDSADIQIWNLEKAEPLKKLQRTVPGFRAWRCPTTIAFWPRSETTIAWFTGTRKRANKSRNRTKPIRSFPCPFSREAIACCVVFRRRSRPAVCA